MRSATRQEIEYLGAVQGKSVADANLIDEMSRRLDALRRYDQYFCDADWRPGHARASTGPKRGKSTP